jgi:hypothetical protein
VAAEPDNVFDFRAVLLRLCRLKLIRLPRNVLVEYPQISTDYRCFHIEIAPSPQCSEHMTGAIPFDTMLARLELDRSQCKSVGTGQEAVFQVLDYISETILNILQGT